MTTSGTIDVRRGGDRLHTRLPWLESHHSFSFSRHYDPTSTGHGLLLVNHDDVRAGIGFSTFAATGRLAAGDAVRLTVAGAPSSSGADSAEILLWELGP